MTVQIKEKEQRKELGMKKKISLIIAFCAALCAFAGCGGNTAQQTDASSGTSASSESTAAQTSAASQTSAETQVTTGTTTEEAAATPDYTENVLYEGNGVKIVTAGFCTLDDYDGGPGIVLNFENNTGKALSVHTLLTSINGWMIDPYALTIDETGYINMGGEYSIPASGDTNRYYLHLGSSPFFNVTVPEITDVSFLFEIIIGDDWENAIHTERVTVHNPNASADKLQAYNDSGTVAYDKDGIKIVLQEAGYDTDYWGPTLDLYASNDSDKPVRIRIPHSVLNGEEHDAYGDAEIAPGCRIRETVMFDGVQEMAPLGTATLTFDIYEYDPSGEGTLLDTSEPCTAEYEPVHIKTQEEIAAETAAAKGWWTRSGNFTDGTDSLTLTFMSVEDNWGSNGWFANGVFGTNHYWGGDMELTDEGLTGTVQSAFVNADMASSEDGDPFTVTITEEGENGVLLTLGTGEQYHFTPAAE